jgi:hypothetical protein
MSSQVRIDFIVSWSLSKEKLSKDPMAKELRNLGQYLPLRIYLAPTNELLTERLINIKDMYEFQEVHFLDLPEGRWSIKCDDPSGWIDTTISKMQLNTVTLKENEFVLN